MPDTKIIRTMFDIKPVDQSGSLDVAKIGLVQQKLNLKQSAKKILSLSVKELSPSLLTREYLVRELNQELKKKTNLRTVLTKVGGSIYDQPTEIKRRPLLIRQTKAEEKKVILPKPEFISLPRPFKKETHVAPNLETRLTSSSVAGELEAWLEKAKNQTWRPVQGQSQKNVLSRRQVLISGLVMLLILTGFLNKDFLEKKITQGGSEAVKNLENAKADIEKLDFASAAKHFTLAYSNFSNAGKNLNLLSSAFTSFMGGIPGLGKLKSAQSLVAAGENIAQAGESLSLAADQLSKTNFVAYFGLNGKQERPLTDFIGSFRDSLIFVQKKVGLANTLLAEVDSQVIPEEKRVSFLDFKEKLPLFEQFLNGALDYSDFLLELVGQSGPKKYLVLFQNNTELRATGGFIGSYALVDFNRGFLRSFEVKDVYDTDGQAKKNIIPPKELQHITPVWGMRDANWFVNFPDSAEKVMEMYTENDGGPAVDGVLTITPAIITKILAVVGPIELDEYGKTMTSENFLAETQEEVEYGPNRQNPKQILVDFAPKFLEKLSDLDKEKWTEIFKILSEGAMQKHILAYFKNSEMEKVALISGFGGEIKKTDQDYLSVIHTNIKGSKSDAVTDNSYILKSDFKEEGLEHSLSIIRKHRGGKSSLGFYNRTNYDYVRVLVPKGSKLLDISGHSSVNFSPVTDYGNGGGFIIDSDLEEYENGQIQIKPGVTQWPEGDKTVFGFWLNVKPGETEKVVLKYQTPVSTQDDVYSLLVQKQPGTLEDFFNFSMNLPEGQQIIYKNQDLTLSDDSLNFQTKLLEDTLLQIKFQ